MHQKKYNTFNWYLVGRLMKYSFSSSRSSWGKVSFSLLKIYPTSLSFSTRKSGPPPVIKITTLKTQLYYITLTLDELERMLDPEMFYHANGNLLLTGLPLQVLKKIFSESLSPNLQLKPLNRSLSSKQIWHKCHISKRIDRP